MNIIYIYIYIYILLYVYMIQMFFNLFLLFKDKDKKIILVNKFVYHSHEANPNLRKKSRNWITSWFFVSDIKYRLGWPFFSFWIYIALNFILIVLVTRISAWFKLKNRVFAHLIKLDSSRWGLCMIWGLFGLYMFLFKENRKEIFSLSPYMHILIHIKF